MAASVYETDGWAIDVNAVKEQLRLLGHDVSDDIILQFIKDVYIPQRSAADAAAAAAADPANSAAPPPASLHVVPHAAATAVTGAPPVAPAPPTSSSAAPRPAADTERAPTPHTTHTSTTASLALADAVESDDAVVLSTEEEPLDVQLPGRARAHHLEPQGPQARPSRAAAPIDVRGDSASDWNDDFGLKSLKISAATTQPSLVQGTAVAAARKPQAHDASAATGLASTASHPAQAKAPPPLQAATAQPLPSPSLSDTTSTRDTLHYSFATAQPSAPQPFAPQPRYSYATAQPPPSRPPAPQARQQPQRDIAPSAPPPTAAAHTDNKSSRQSPLASLLADANRARRIDQDPAPTRTDHSTYSFLPRTRTDLQAPPPPTAPSASTPLPGVDDHPTQPASRHSDTAPPRQGQMHTAAPAPRAAAPRPATTGLPPQPVVHPYSFLADTAWMAPDDAAATATHTARSSPLAEPPLPGESSVAPPRRSSHGRAEGSVSSFSTRSATSSMQSSTGGKRKVDRVNRYHELAAGWENDRFLKRNNSKPKQAFNFHTYFASLHASEAHQQQQRKQAARAKTQKALAPAATYQVPTEKRRDSLRWEVRMQMLRPAESVDL